MKLTFFIPLLALTVFLAGCTTSTPVRNTVNNDISANEQPSTGEDIGEASSAYSLTDVTAHNSRDDCWLAIHGKVYDVTDFIADHPGRDAILEGCGKDASDLYETRPMGSGTPHSQRARGLLDDYYIGDLNG
jgi:cytochrome b involved in lipid metabolism